MERTDNRYSRLHMLNVILNILAIITFFFDNATDIIVMWEYFSSNLIKEFCLMFTFLLIPSAIIQFFSFSWFYDCDGKVGWLVYLTHILFMGLIHRYVLTLFACVKARRSNEDVELYNHYYQHQSGVSILRLFDAFLHSTPLLLIQVHIMLTRHQWSYWTAISAFTALISLSWSISTYNKDMRNARPDKQPLTNAGILFLTLWRSGTLTSRILSLVLFARVLPYTTFSILLFHWFCMFLWIYHQETDFCTSEWEERIYNAVSAVIYCFCFFNLKEGKSRYRLLIFYFVMFLENSIFISCYLYFSSSNQLYDLHDDQSLLFTPFYKIILVTITLFSFLFGLVNMVLYYCYFHPSSIAITGTIKLCFFASEEEKNVNELNRIYHIDVKSANNLNRPASLRLKYRQSFNHNANNFNI